MGRRPTAHYTYAANGPADNKDPDGRYNRPSANPEMLLEADRVTDDQGVDLGSVPRTLHVDSVTGQAHVEIHSRGAFNVHIEVQLEKDLYGYSSWEMGWAESRKKAAGMALQGLKTIGNILEVKAGIALTATGIGALPGAYLIASGTSDIAGDVVDPSLDVVGRTHEAVFGDYAKYTRPGASILAGGAGGALSYLRKRSAEKIVGQIAAGVADDALVNFGRTVRTTVNPTYGKSYWFRFGDIKHLTLSQIEALIGPGASAGEQGAAAVLRVANTPASITKVATQLNMANIAEYTASEAVTTTSVVLPR